MGNRLKRKSFESKINVDRCRLDINLDQFLKTKSRYIKYGMLTGWEKNDSQLKPYWSVSRIAADRRLRMKGDKRTPQEF